MFDPRFWVAMFLVLMATALTMFGVGWHYGDKGKIAVTKYTALQSEKAKVDADLKQAEKNYADAKAKNATAAGDAGRTLAGKEQTIEKQQRDIASLQRAHQKDVADLATARLMLTDANTDAERADRAAALAADQRAAESTNTAGRLGACQSAVQGLLTSSGVNNAELKRAIARRDACVQQYEAVERNVNGN